MNKKILYIGILASLIGTSSTFAGNCNFTCNNDGSTVTINNSCDLTKSIDCRGNNIVLNNNVVVNIKPGVEFMLDLKNHSLTTKPGAKINIDKSAIVKNGILKPEIISFQGGAGGGLSTTDTLPDITIRGTQGADSSDHYDTYTVPNGVKKITIKFDVEYHEESCCDGLRLRIYKNGNLLKDWGRHAGNGNKNFTYTLDVNPGDTIKVGAYQYHDGSANRGDSYIRNIKIQYSLPDADIKFAGSNYNVKVITELSTDGGRTFPYKYTASYDESKNGKIENILGKKGLTSYLSNSNLKARIKVCPIGVPDNSSECKVSSVVGIGYTNPAYIPPLDKYDFKPINTTNYTFSSRNSNGYNNDSIWGYITDGYITIYSKDKTYNLNGVKKFEAQFNGGNIGAPSCRSNSVGVGIIGSNNSAIQMYIQNRGSSSWLYRGGTFNSNVGFGNYQLLKPASNAWRMLVFLVRDKNGKQFIWYYKAEVGNLINVKLKGWIDFNNKKAHFELYKSDGTKIIDDTKDISLPSNGFNFNNMATDGKPFAWASITCNRGGVPFTYQKVYVNGSYVGIEK